jgi:Kef-type K+ transport system membrane component KefB
MTFGVLALLVAAGLAGPLLAAARPSLVPVIVGELLAGVVIGRSGFGWLHPDDPTVAFLAGVGFAMLMFTVGLHVPLGRPEIRMGLRRGAMAAAVTGAIAVPCGLAISALTDTGHAAVYALLLGSGSAAIVGPVLDERRLQRRLDAAVLLAQVSVADVAAVVALPLVLQPDRAWHALGGGALVAVAALTLHAIVVRTQRLAAVQRTRRLSKRRGWALDLRLSLLALSVLAWIAERSGTAVLLAGFSAGLIVSSLGGPKRLSRQITGIGAGFFVPLFFVVLGARIDVRAFAEQASLLGLLALLVTVNVAIHLLGAALTGQRPAAGLAATAQLGVPAAVASIGLQQGVLTDGQAAAILVAALVSVATCAVGVAWLASTPPS